MRNVSLTISVQPLFVQNNAPSGAATDIRRMAAWQPHGYYSSDFQSLKKLVHLQRFPLDSSQNANVVFLLTVWEALSRQFKTLTGVQVMNFNSLNEKCLWSLRSTWFLLTTSHHNTRQHNRLFLEKKKKTFAFHVRTSQRQFGWGAALYFLIVRHKANLCSISTIQRPKWRDTKTKIMANKDKGRRQEHNTGNAVVSK